MIRNSAKKTFPLFMGWLLGIASKSSAERKRIWGKEKKNYGGWAEIVNYIDQVYNKKKKAEALS
ncbi:MAG: hypothetical protein IJX52_00470 [Oscillibacter sp.]|nr:hypothetical protein [Oscillibacter sp.]